MKGHMTMALAPLPHNPHEITAIPDPSPTDDLDLCACFSCYMQRHRADWEYDPECYCDICVEERLTAHET